MPFNGSGTFNRATPSYTGATAWAQEDAAGFKIVTTRHDTHDQDIAAGLSNTICKDGQTTPTANLPMGGFRHTNVGSGAARTDYPSVGQIQDGSLLMGGTSGGSANAQTLSLTPAITAYVNGMTIRFIAGFTTTSAATLNVNGVGAAAIWKTTGLALSPSDIIAGELVDVCYNSTSGTFCLMSPSRSRYGTWSPTFTPAGSMTFSSTSTLANQFYQQGSLMFFRVGLQTTVGGTPSNYFTFTLPATADANINTAYGYVNEAGAQKACFITNNDATSLRVYKYDSSNYIAGSLAVLIQGFYTLA